MNPVSSRRAGWSPALLVSIILAVAIFGLAAPLVTAQTEDQRKLVHAAGTVYEWPGKAKRFALIVGVDEYQDSQINKLEGASNDAKALAGALVECAGFPTDQVILLTSDQALDHQPNRANIMRRLSNLRQAVPRDGLLLVSFAGHGMERDGRAYLLPMDAQVSGDIALVEDSAINVETMRDRIRQTAVGQVVLIVDACRNNPASGRGESGNPLTDAYIRAFNFDVRNREVTAFATLYATGVGQVAHEYKDKKQGYFTWALVEGLKGGAADEKGEVTLASLVRYVQEKVPELIRIELGAEKQQKPFAVIEGYKADELVISIANKLPQAVNGSFELEFWRSIQNSTNAEDYKAYLEKYPDGTFAGLARNRVRSLAGDKATQSDSAPLPPNKSFNPTRTTTVDVIAKRDWTSSGLLVEKGDRIRITATGRVTLDTNTGQTSGPEGIDQPDAKKLMQDKPTGALIAVIGADNDDFIFIGSSGEFVAARQGLLFLSVNEGNLSDNEGSFKATIEIQSKKGTSR